MQPIYYDRELADRYDWWTLTVIIVECDYEESEYVCDQVSVSAWSEYDSVAFGISST